MKPDHNDVEENRTLLLLRWLVPVTLSGANSIGLSYTSFGLTLIGGLTTATLLTLLVVPVFYTFFDDAQLLTGRAIRHALGTGPEGDRAEA